MKTKIFCILSIMMLITLLFPIGSAYIQNKEILTDIKTQSSIDEPVNYLGKITAYHRVFGFKVFFEDTNSRDFYFPVVDGKVYLNFTVSGCHILDDLAWMLRDIIQRKTGFLCQVRGDFFTTYAKGSISYPCNAHDEPDCNYFKVNYTSVELELDKGESKKLWVGFGCWNFYQILHGNPIPGSFIYPRNDWYDFWNLLYPGIVFQITVHGT